ncbi:response regulator transcription factor [Streptomyces ossamyceticus]|jgi:DNA-binding response OmpR family regulator|uniref:response regulator transcription factor n=1 Tax=Streptomyces ossamyceticus TaxID=249581 RepID=UPI0006E1B052|nr:response regulator transcription factor [Streptomyces ossamyceticus]
MRLLLVEDERRLADVIKSGLVDKGFAVDAVGDGNEAVWMAGEHRYDAIVLDVMLPGLNGFAVCRKLRDAGNWAPILMLTAMDGELDEVRALDSGADDYLAKPFSFAVLLARLRALVRRGTQERPAVLQVGDLQVDPAAACARRGDVHIALTPKEFAVLHLLARRAGQAVAKAELLSHAWDFAFDGDPNIVEVYVSALRRKIDAPFGVRTLTTVRGFGYLLERP